MLRFPFYFPLSCHCLWFWYWAMLLKVMDKKGVDSAQIVWHWIPDHTVYLSWSLAQSGMGKHWTPLPSRMPYFISNLLLIRVALSFMCHQGSGLLEVSISRATSHSSWKEVLSFLGLRYWSTLSLKSHVLFCFPLVSKFFTIVF